VTEIGTGHRALSQLGPSPALRAASEPPSVPEPVSPVRSAPLPTGLELPTPRDVVEGGHDLLRDWHPRDPSIRVNGRFRSATRDEAPVEPGAEADGGARSGAARAAMFIGLGGGFVQNGIDVARMAKKFPEALRAARFDPALGRAGRLPTALSLAVQTRVDSRIVDPLAPRMATAASLGKSFTRFDEIAMRASVLLGASLSIVQIGSAIPNIADAVSKDGPWHENLLQSTPGRFGVLQLGGGLLGASIFTAALRQTAGQAGEGVITRILAAGKSPLMAKPLWGQIGIGTGLLVAANELGYLDMLNVGETRSTKQVLSDAAHRTPVINDPKLRTAAILGAGGVVGYKAHRAFAAAGGSMAGVGKGHWIAGAAVAGLLGVHLLGGLSALNRPQQQ
jgi:hypothetical protein